MKKSKWIMLGILLGGILLASAQKTDSTAATVANQRWQMADFSEASATAKDAASRIATAADYLKLALVLGLGVLIGRMGAVSQQELTQFKADLARLVGPNVDKSKPSI